MATPFLVLGDTPYTDDQIPALTAAIASFGGTGAAFAVHVGDLKTGSSPCDDATLAARRDQLAASPIPLFYTPGDNEWTDCHRTPIDGHPVDPVERLARLRTLFFAAPLGATTLPATAQETYVENQRWSVDGLTFATVHVVGSRDGWDGDRDEARARRAADLVWLEATFAQATATGSPAVVLFQQADPDFGARVFRSWTEALEAQAAAFPGPVLLVHGDSHRERGPFRWAGTERLWRYIVPGEVVAPRLVSVDAAAKTPFTVSDPAR
jgi:hypothetical protein